LNERGSRILIDSPNAVQLQEAERQFQWALALNQNCSLCYQNLGDTYLRLDQPAQAEAALRQQIALLPRDSDAYFALGNALRGQERADEARVAYESAVRITPTDHESHLGLASTLGSLGRTSEQVVAYRKALQVRPTDVATWINLGVALSAGEHTEAETEAAFRSGVDAGANDARAPLNLGRYLTKLSRPAEAIHYFDRAASVDAEYLADVELSIATARAQQGRLREAIDHFMRASTMRPTDTKLQEAIVEMQLNADQVERQRATADAVAEVCGTPCQDIIDGAGTAVCASSWFEGCGDAEPPSGFHGDSTVAEMCPRACAHYLDQR
jgi:tetratricopeptide (TPR) repeat protein